MVNRGGGVATVGKAEVGRLDLFIAPRHFSSLSHLSIVGQCSDSDSVLATTSHEEIEEVEQSPGVGRPKGFLMKGDLCSNLGELWGFSDLISWGSNCREEVHRWFGRG